MIAVVKLHKLFDDFVSTMYMNDNVQVPKFVNILLIMLTLSKYDYQEVSRWHLFYVFLLFLRT